MNDLVRYLKIAVVVQLFLEVALEVFIPDFTASLMPWLRQAYLPILFGEFFLLGSIVSISILIKGVYWGRVAGPPGVRLAKLAESVFTKKFYDRVLKPVLVDMEKEYFEALREGKPGKARLLRAYYTVAFWWIALSQVPISVLKLVASFWRIG